MSITISKELIDYYAPLSAVAAGKEIAALSSRDFLGMMSLGSDDCLYLFCNSAGAKAAPFQRIKIDDRVFGFAAMRLKGKSTFVFAYIKNDSVYMCVTDTPRALTKDVFRRVNLSLKGYMDCVPESLNITGLDDQAYLSVAMKNQSGRIRRITVDCSDYAVSPFVLSSNFSKIKREVFGRSIQEAVDGMYTLGEYGGKTQLLYTPLFNVFGKTPPSPKRLLTPQNGGDSLSICPLKNGVGTHLFVAGGGGIAYYPYSMQYDCAHAENPNPIIIQADNPHLSEVTAMSSFINDAKIYVYVLSSSGQVYYAFASYDEELDKAGDFSELLLLRENCLYFRATEGKMFICEKNRLLFGARDLESGAYRWKAAHYEADTGKFICFKGVMTKIITDKPETEITIKASNAIEAYINGSFHNFTSLTMKSDKTCMLDIVQYADSLTIEPFTVTENGAKIFVDPSVAYHDRLNGLTTADGIKNAQIKSPNGQTTMLLQDGADEAALKAAAGAISELLNAPVMRTNFTASNSRGTGCIHTACIAQISNGERIFGEKLTGDGEANGLLYFMDDVFNFLYKIGKTIVTFVTKVVGSVIEFVVQIGKQIFKFVLNTAWKVLEAIAKVLAYIGIPLNKLLDFLKFTFDTNAIVKEKDYLKQMLKDSIQNAKPAIKEAQAKADNVLDQAAQSVADWAGISVPAEVDKEPDNIPQKSSQNMYLFDIIWRRFDIVSLFDTTITVTPSAALLASAEQFYSVIGVEGVGETFQNSIDSIFNWALQQDGSVKTSDMINSLKAVAGMIAVPTIQFTRRIMDAMFDFFIQLIDFIGEVMDVKLHIPILSDILKLFGIADFSVLDLIMLPAAFFYRMVSYFIDGGEIALQSRMLSSGKEVMDAESRIPDKDTRHSVLAFQVVIFLVETVETVYTFISLEEAKSEEAEKHFVLISILGLLLTIVDFGLCFGSGCYYAPMSAENVQAAEVYGILWYIKTALSAVINIVGMFGKKTCKLFIKWGKIILNVVYCAAAIVAFVFECIAIDNARKSDCPAGADREDFNKDKNLFILQTASYLVDEVRNIIDGIMGIIEAFKTSAAKVGDIDLDIPKKPPDTSCVELFVHFIRACLSEAYAILQLTFGIALVCD